MERIGTEKGKVNIILNNLNLIYIYIVSFYLI